MAPIDAPGKARHCALMVLAASVLADCGNDDLQRRALGRYAFLYADAQLEWCRRWRNQLAREPATAKQAHRAKEQVAALGNALGAAGGVRDYLAAKRQAVSAIRADDIEGTSLLWAAVNAGTVRVITSTAVRAYAALDAIDGGRPALLEQIGLGFQDQARIRAALPTRDPDYWYIAADTAADLRAYTLPAAQGGELGRLIAQINDVATHLDVLLRMTPILWGKPPYDWLVRSALAVELNALLDLTLGPPPTGRRAVLYPLVDLCRQGRAKTAANELERLRGSISQEGWNYVRWMRNSLGAHVDDNITIFHVHQHLSQFDYGGVIRLAEHVLDWLDALGATELDLGLLLFGERCVRSWPVDPNIHAPGRPTRVTLSGILADLFRRIDSPFMSATASSLGSAALAGMLSARKPAPRRRVTVPDRLDLSDPIPLSLRRRTGAPPTASNDELHPSR